MIFLTETDLNVQVKKTLLNRATDEKTDLIDTAELVAIEEMSGYLRSQYDVAKIFSTQNDNEQTDYTVRNKLVVMYAVDIVAYHIFCRLELTEGLQLRGIRYERAIEWLKAVEKGTISPGLPTLPDVPNSDYNKRVRWKANKPKSQL